MDDWEPLNKDYPPPKPGEPELFRAARVGDHDAIRRLVAAGADVNSVFDIKLDPGSYVDNVTPLMVAAGSGDGATVETVRLLLQLGADPRAEDAWCTPAERACSGLGWNYRPGGDVQRLEELLKAGSPLPPMGKRAARLLSDTAAWGDPARLAVLLREGFSPHPAWDAEQAKRDAAKSRATIAGYRAKQPLDSLLENLPPEARKAFEQSMRENEDRMEAEQASAPWSFEIPLFRAVESGSIECVRLLLDAGADPLFRDNRQRTAHFEVASAEIARELVRRGLSPGDRNSLGWSPLMDAVSDGDVRRIEALIAVGADVNDASHDRGYTLFMMAVGSGRNRAVLEYLVRAGADVHAVSEIGYNAFHAAIDVNGADANAEQSVREAFEFLKRHGVSMEHRNNMGHTPLARAIQDGTGIEVRVLCELGADPNAPASFYFCGGESRGNIEQRPLFGASQAAVDSPAKTEALLRAGAEVLHKNADGYRAMDLLVATLCSQTDDREDAWRRFWSGLQSLPRPAGIAELDDESFLARVRPGFREFVRAFAAPIPIRDRSEFAAKWREQQIKTIELLITYGSLALHRAAP